MKKIYVSHFHLIFHLPLPFPLLSIPLSPEEVFFLNFTLFPLKFLSKTTSHCYVYIAQNFKKYNMKDSKKSPSRPEPLLHHPSPETSNPTSF